RLAVDCYRNRADKLCSVQAALRAQSRVAPVRLIAAGEDMKVRLAQSLSNVETTYRKRNTSLRSRRKHKAWGGAKRNPRHDNQRIHSPRSGRQSNRLGKRYCFALLLSPAFAGSQSFSRLFLGLMLQALC